ncbi:hypothetical protein BaRGS_00014603 [Batillaria attramentaria]|uniref:Microsomal glutathione S-transferase 2 n=1 Tax=Batillaria attramentaria TaxID=370345 RepID=A0ABD0L462_9CAEN
MSDEASKAMMAADDFALPAFVTFLSLGQHARFARRVGLARGKYKVDVPETTGDPGFVRVFRAHQNSMEFYPLALTSMWVSSVYFHPVPASLAGLVYIYGRQSYFDGYAESSAARLPGFMLSLNAVLLLMGMSGVGVTAALLRRYADLDLAAMAKGFVEGILKKD